MLQLFNPVAGDTSGYSILSEGDNSSSSSHLVSSFSLLLLPFLLFLASLLLYQAIKCMSLANIISTRIDQLSYC